MCSYPCLMLFLNYLNVCLFGETQNVLNIQFYNFCKYCICLYIITLTPICRTTGDGNCLYNACSIALCGTENLTPYLRCLTSTKLFVNCLFYVKYPILEQQHNKGAFSSIGNAFAMCLSDIALNSLAKEDLSKSVIAEAYSNALNRQWSSFLCLLALSSAVKLPVEAYFQYPKMKPQKRRKIHCRPCLIASSIHA